MDEVPHLKIGNIKLDLKRPGLYSSKPHPIWAEIYFKDGQWFGRVTFMDDSSYVTSLSTRYGHINANLAAAEIQQQIEQIYYSCLGVVGLR